MRNYWMRIALGAIAIFTVGMVARALINRGLGGVRGMVEGSGPLSIPLAFIPFQLGGEKLGTFERVTLQRTTPRSVSSVQLEVKLSDSLLARGLKGCSLAANLENDGNGLEDINIHRGRLSDGNFWCAQDAATDTNLVEYGKAVFRPGEVSVPLYLTRDLVDDLQNLDFGHDSASVVAEAEAQAEAVMEAAAESAVAAEQAVAAAAPERARARARMVDSLRAEGLRRADSALQMMTRMADSTPAR